MNHTVDDLNFYSAGWIQDLWRASWQGGLFIAAIWIICRCFPRIPASIRHWFWIIAGLQMIVRLLAPASIPVPILPAHVSPTTAVESSLERATATTVSGTTGRQGTTLNVVSIENPVQESHTPAMPLFLGLVWLGGLTFFLASSLRKLLRTGDLRRTFVTIEDPRLLQQLEELSHRLGIQAPRLVESRLAPCPLLAGWLTPTIVLPEGSTSAFSDDESRMALAHELVHLKRKDLWLDLIPTIALVIFFFHPLSWLVASEATAAREEACDIESLSISGGSRAAYARLLLNSAQASSSLAVMGSAFGYRLIKRRISMLKTSQTGYGPIAKRAFSCVLVLSTVIALPWSVTAQSASKSSTQAKKAPAKPNKQKVATRSSIASNLKHVVPTPPAMLAGPAAPNARPPHFGIPVDPSRAISAPMPPAMLAGPAAPNDGPPHFGIPVDPARTINAPMPALSVPAGLAPAQVAAGAPRSRHATQYLVADAARPPLIPTPMVQSLRSNVSQLKLPAQSVRNAMPPQVTQYILPGGQVIAADAPPALEQWDNTHSVTLDGKGSLDIRLENVDIKTALKELCKAVKLDYIIRSDVRKDTVTLSLHHVPAVVAIEAILNAVEQKVTYRVDGGVYHFIPKD